MPHKCAVCSKVYDNYAIEIVRGCDCGSKIFLYQRLSQITPAKKAPEGNVAPGPAARQTSEIVKEVKSVIKNYKKHSKKVEFDLDTIKVIEDGVYDININKILNNEPLIIEIKEDGKYFIHLASLFKEKVNTLEKEDLEIKSKKVSGRKHTKKK